MSKKARISLLLLKASASVLLVWLVLRRVNPGEVWARLRLADPLLLGVGLLLSIAVLFVGALRWRMLARGAVSYGLALRYTWIGLFYGAILPGGVSGDIAKGAALALKDTSTRSAWLPLSIVADRVVGFLALMVLLGLAGARLLVVRSEDAAALQAMGILCIVASLAVVGGSIWLSRPAGLRGARRLLERRLPARLKARLWPVLEAIEDYAGVPGLWPRALGISFVGHLLNLAYYAALLGALDIDLPLDAAMVLYALLGFLVMIPISISGIGVREWFTLAFFPAFGQSAGSGVAFSWAAIALHWIVASIGGLLQAIEFFRTPDARPTAP